MLCIILIGYFCCGRCAQGSGFGLASEFCRNRKVPDQIARGTVDLLPRVLIRHAAQNPFPFSEKWSST